jgi:DNA polymerase III subunit gamma/tau
VIDAGHDPRRFAMDLLERFRDLIVLQAVPDAASRGVVDAPEDVLDRMREQAVRLGPATLTRYAEVVQAGLGEMRGATAPRLLLEVVCARLLLPSASDAESALLQRVERIETRLDMSIPVSEAAARPARAEPAARPNPPTRRSAVATPAEAPRPTVAAKPTEAPRPTVAAKPTEAPRPAEPARAPEPKRTPVSQPAPLPEPPPPATEHAPVPGELNAAAVRTMWPTVRDKVRQRSRTTEVMLAGATVRAVEGGTLVLSHESAPLARRLSEQRNADVIAEALKDALGVNWRVRCETGPAASAEMSLPAPKVEEPVPDAHSVQRDEEETMLAEAGRNDTSAPRRDPEEVALELLQNELGARRIEG